MLTYTNGYYIYLKISVIFFCPPTPCDLQMFRLMITFCLMLQDGQSTKVGILATPCSQGLGFRDAPTHFVAFYPTQNIHSMSKITWISDWVSKYGIWECMLCTTLCPRVLLELRNFNACNNLNFYFNSFKLSLNPPKRRKS